MVLPAVACQKTSVTQQNPGATMNPKKVARIAFLLLALSFTGFALVGGTISPLWALLPAPVLLAAAYHFLVLEPFWKAA